MITRDSVLIERLLNGLLPSSLAALLCLAAVPRADAQAALSISKTHSGNCGGDNLHPERCRGCGRQLPGHRRDRQRAAYRDFAASEYGIRFGRRRGTASATDSTIVPPPSGLSLVSVPNPSILGQAVTSTATVRPPLLLDSSIL